MLSNLFAQLGKTNTNVMGNSPSKTNTAIPPKPSFPMAQPAASLFDNGFNHGSFLNNLNSAGRLQKFDWSNGLDQNTNEGMRSYSDGEYVYSPIWQMMTQGSGVDMADIGYNKDFPVSVSRSRIADLVRHSDGRYERPIGSTNWILDPNTGQVLETNVKQKDNSLKEFAGAAALAFGGAAALSGLLGAAGAAGGGAGAAGGAAPTITGTPFFGGGLAPAMQAGGAATSFGGATGAMSGFGGLGAGLGYGASLESAMAGLGAAGAAGAAGAGAGAPALQGVPPPANPFAPSSYLNPTNLKNAITSPMGMEKLFVNPLTRNFAGQALGGLFSGGNAGGQGGEGGGLGNVLGGLSSLIPGAIDAYQQGRASDKMLAWLDKQQGKIDNLYNPGSPEYNLLWDQMSRQDAAAGRNSQYGPRSVDLAAKIAEIKAANTAKLTSGVAGVRQDALNQDASRFAGLGAGASRLLGGGGGNSVISTLGDLFMNRNPSTGVGFDIIPQGSPFTPASTFDVDQMVNGFDFGGESAFDGGGFDFDFGSWFE